MCLISVKALAKHLASTMVLRVQCSMNNYNNYWVAIEKCGNTHSHLTAPPLCAPTSTETARRHSNVRRLGGRILVHIETIYILLATIYRSWGHMVHAPPMGMQGALTSSSFAFKSQRCPHNLFNPWRHS
ncbi:hypothetical protein RRG08_059154 [Elysia crispata]|uniref:Uncharacterized protein n=1 Tax=Elysia crispata TaxID=231223 RepID=A0AAE0ZXD9_9GAST|nr:hypothetical protein RRG08_059154 [Elysia crispata]